MWSFMIVLFKTAPSQKDLVVLLFTSVELRYVINCCINLLYISQFNFVSCVNELISAFLDFWYTITLLWNVPLLKLSISWYISEINNSIYKLWSVWYVVKTPSFSSITKLIERVNDWASYKDSAVTNLAERLTNVTSEKLFEKNIVYHRDCYSEIANVEKLERVKKRYSDSVESDQRVLVTTRSTSSFFDKALCIICQCPGGILNRVKFNPTRHNTLDVSSKLLDKTFFCPLNSTSIAEDAVANDVIYHNLC